MQVSILLDNYILFCSGWDRQLFTMMSCLDAKLLDMRLPQ